MPPVSSSSKARPFHSHGTRLRSRVTPGSAWVTASRPPARRLTRVLLPTLGKPTTATVGRRLIRPPGALYWCIGPKRRPEQSCQTLFAGEGNDSIGHFVQGEAGGVDLDRVPGWAEGAVLTGLVPLVALALGGQHRRLVLAALCGAAAGTLLRRRGEEDLERRIGADDRADVAALGDVATGGDQPPLAL